jgi:hypothetical protein
MPDLHEYVSLSRYADPRLGFHHGYLLSPVPARLEAVPARNSSDAR